MNVYQRVAIYLNQGGRGQLTPRQSRRANKKMNRHEAKHRLRKDDDQ